MILIGLLGLGRIGQVCAHRIATSHHIIITTASNAYSTAVDTFLKETGVISAIKI